MVAQVVPRLRLELRTRKCDSPVEIHFLGATTLWIAFFATDIGFIGLNCIRVSALQMSLEGWLRHD